MSKKKNSSSIQWMTPPKMMFGSALICVVLVPLVHAAVSQTAEKTARQNELANMTKSERLRLEHKYEQFQQLSEAEKEKYRNLHQRLNGPEIALKPTLASYQVFMTALSPIERAEIEKQPDKGSRVLAIERIQKEREYRQQQLDLGLAQVDEFRSSFEQTIERNGWGNLLTLEEMNAIGGVIENQLPSEVRLRAELDLYQGYPRYARILAAAMKTWGPKPTGVARTPLPEGIVDEIVGVIDNSALSKNMQRIPEDRPDMRIFALMMMSERSLMAQGMEEVPGVAELQEFLETREEDVKKKLMNQEPGRMYLELVKLYRETHPTPLSDALKEMHGELEDYKSLIRSQFRGPVPGGRRGFGDDRGPDGREFNRRGSGEGRPPRGEPGEKKREPGSGPFRPEGGPLRDRLKPPRETASEPDIP